ncbi:MAG: hypothetical protein ACR2O4_05810 [Hyphomicrobiaceae bacterium]
MAFPYIFSSAFDTGDNSEWDSESDTGGLLDFPHYTELARLPGGSAPYRGAHCMRIQPGDTNDHILIEGDINIADTATAHTRFALYISDSFAATADDIFNIFEWQQAGGTVEAAISLQVIATTDLVNIAIADGTAASSGFQTITKGKWHVIEALFTVDVAPGTNGVLTLFVDGDQYQTVTGHNQAAAVGRGVLGTQDTLATTTGGFLLFDEFAFDDTRLGVTDRWTESRTVTTDAFAFVGKGQINNVTILDGGSGDVSVELYDTDVFNSSLTPVWRSRTIVADTDVYFEDLNIPFRRGCLVNLAGTLPGASVQISKMTAWGSDGSVRLHGSKRAGTLPI